MTRGAGGLARALVLVLVGATLAGATLAEARPRARKPVVVDEPEDGAEAEAGLEDAADGYVQAGEPAKAILIYDQLRLERPFEHGLLDGLLDACLVSAPCHPRLATLLGQAEITAADRDEVIDRAATALANAGWRGPAGEALRRYVARQPDALEIWRTCAERLVETRRAARALAELDREPPARSPGLRLLQLELVTATAPARIDATVAAILRDFPGLVDGWAVLGERALERDDVAGARRAAARGRAGTLASTAGRARLAELELELAATHVERRRDVRQAVRYADHMDDVEPGSDY